MSQYHKYVIDVNSDIQILETCPNPITALNFKQMSIFNELGSTMPKREGYPDLAIWPIIVYIICAMICCICSFTFHMFQPISPRVFKVMHRLDMSGITICTFGSINAIIYYAFYCEPLKRNIWIALQFLVNFGAFF